MFTDAQMEMYNEILSGKFESVGGPGADADWQPPRVADLHDFPTDIVGDPDSDPEGFGDGTVLLFGFQDEELRDCECENSHVTYAAIRADGLLSPYTTSNTFGETSAVYGVDPISIMLGMIPDDLGDPPVPTWDTSREVTPDEWPAESITRDAGTSTDMKDFEF